MEENNDITLKEIIVIIKNFYNELGLNKVKIIITGILFCLFGLVLALGQNDEYNSKIKLFPLKASKSRLDGLGGLASLAGMNLSQQNTGQVVPVSIYQDIVESISFRDSLASVLLNFESIPRKISFYEYKENYYKESFNEKASRFIKRLFSFSFLNSNKTTNTPATSKENQGINVQEEELLMMSGKKLGILNELLERNIFEFNEQKGIIVITSIMPDKKAAAGMARNYLSVLESTIKKFELQKLTEQSVYLENQYLASKVEFEVKQKNLADFQDKNQGLISSSIKIREQHLQNEYNLAFEIFRNLANQREMLKLKMNEDSAAFAIIEQPYVPNKPFAPLIGKYLIGFLILGLIIGSLFFIVKYIIKSNI